MGRVYKAYDLRSKRKVAIKVFTPQKGISLAPLEEFSALFRLNHPHLPQIYQLGKTNDGRDFLVMELVEGENIIISFKKWEYEHFLQLLLQICETLEFIHSRGYVHSDLKPRHILIDKAEGVKIMDLGLAQFIGLPSGGGIRGTPGYIAPEVLKGERGDGRSDLYSLGVVLYELWTGRKPFPYSDVARVIEAHLYEEVVSPSSLNPEVPLPINRVILKLLEKEPSQRFQSALEVIENLFPRITIGFPKHLKYRFKLPRGQFIGRKEELDHLFLGFARIHSNRLSSPPPGPRAFLIRGEEGIGKSRLLEEFKFLLQVRGVPFFPVGVIKEGGGFNLVLSESPLTLESSGVSPFAPHLFGPKLSSIFRDLTIKLAEMAQDRPLILFFDDLERADGVWMEFWEAMAINNPSAMVIGTWEGAEPEGKFSQIRRRLKEKGLLEEIKLGPLNGEELNSLVASILGTCGADSLAKLIGEQSGGNPLFVEELLDLLADEGLIYRSQGKWRIREEKLGLLPLPVGIKGVLRRRVYLLKPQERRLLEVASVIGHHFDLEALHQLSGFGDIEPILGELLRAQFIQRVGVHPSRFRFSNRMLHRIVYEDMDDGVRVELHRRLGSYLRQVKGEARGFCFPIAYHLLKGKLRGQSLLWFLKAAKEYSRRLLDYPRAISCYAEAIKIIEEEYKKIPWRLYQRQGETFFYLGEYEKAREAFQTILMVSRQGGNRVWQGRGENGLGLVYYCLGRYAEARSHMKSALQVAKALKSKDIEIEAMNNLSRVNESLGLYQRAIRGYRRALRLSAILGDEKRKGEVLFNLGYLFTQEGDYTQAINCFRQGRRISWRRGDRGGVAYSCLGMGNIHFYRSSFPLALKHYRAALRWAKEVKDRWMEGISLNNISRIYIALGRLNEAEELNEEAKEVLIEVGDRRGEALVLLNRGTIFSQRGIYEKARRSLLEALMIYQEINHPRGIAWVMTNLAEVDIALGDTEGARKLLGRVRKIADKLESKVLRARALIAFAAYSFLVGDHSQAERAVWGALAISRKIGYVEFVLTSLLLESQLEMERGDLKRAFRSSSRVWRTAQPLKRRYEGTRASIQLARIEIESGRLKEALKWAMAAEKMAKSSGMNGVLWMAHHQMGRASYYEGRFAQAKREYEECFQILRSLILEIEEERLRRTFQRRPEVISFAQDVELLRRAC